MRNVDLQGTKTLARILDIRDGQEKVRYGECVLRRYLVGKGWATAEILLIRDRGACSETKISGRRSHCLQVGLVVGKILNEAVKAKEKSLQVADINYNVKEIERQLSGKWKRCSNVSSGGHRQAAGATR